MNIGQLETALGMTRANIRFYEKEGLLSPARSENGYRDYTGSDLDILRRIKLLRQLQFSLEDIRAMQTGALDLPAALRQQEARLQRQTDDLDAARALCRTMEADGVQYRDLNAGKYLEEMVRLEQGGVRFQSVERDALPTVNHPWRRFFARSLDFSLCRLLLDAVLALGFRTTAGDGLMWDLLMAYLTWGVQFLLEPLLLSTWGFTPGKWLFGLAVRNADGGKLTFSQAFGRLSALFGRGEGWGIPFYALYRNYKSMRALEEGEVLLWEETCAYTIRDLRPVRWVGFLGAEAALLAVSLLLGLHVLVPPVRHPLTVAEFSRNYNAALRRYGGTETYVLDADGGWVKVAPAGTYSIGLSDPPPALQYTLEDGVVTGVSFTTSAAPSFLNSNDSLALFSLLALLPAQPEVGLHNWYFASRDTTSQLGGSFEDFSFTRYGLTITNRVDYSGYEAVGKHYLLPIEGQTQTFRQTFSIIAAG